MHNIETAISEAVNAGIALSTFIPQTYIYGHFGTTSRTAYNWVNVPFYVIDALTRDIVMGHERSMSLGFNS